MKKLSLLVLPLVVLLGAGCSQQQDIGDAAKPPPPGATTAPNPVAGGNGPTATAAEPK